MRSTVEVDQETLEDPDLRLAEPLVGRMQFQNSGDLLNISGKLKTVLEVACARCLADVRACECLLFGSGITANPSVVQGSSDAGVDRCRRTEPGAAGAPERLLLYQTCRRLRRGSAAPRGVRRQEAARRAEREAQSEIGRASCRERV